MIERISAVFDTEMEAERAINDLRDNGITDEQLSIIAKHKGDTKSRGEGAMASEAKEEAGDMASRTGKGLLAGAGVGALFGLAAAFIPGVGPFITAGWLATTLGATAGGAVSGAIVGGTAGALAGALAKAGYSHEEANAYCEAIERGSVFVAIDTRNSALSVEQIKSILVDEGGRFINTSSKVMSA